MQFFRLFLVSLACFCSIPALASNLLSVEKIAISAKGNSAKEARQIAVEEGEKKALEIVLKRITSAMATQTLLEQMESADISLLIQSMDMLSEKVTPNHYKANVTFTFNTQLLKNRLEQEGIAFDTTPSDPVMVIPVLYENNSIILWDTPNPWLAQWQATKDHSNFIPIIIPQADKPLIQTTAIERLLSDEYSLSNDYAMRRAMQQTNADSVLLAEARYSINRSRNSYFLQVYLTTITNEGISKQRQSFSGKLGMPLEALFRGAIKKIIERMEQAYRDQQNAQKLTKQVFSLIVPVKDLAYWQMMKNRLDNINAIEKVVVNELSVQRALVDLHFTVSYSELMRHLYSRGLLVEDNGIDVLLVEYSQQESDEGFW